MSLGSAIVQYHHVKMISLKKRLANEGKKIRSVGFPGSPDTWGHFDNGVCGRREGSPDNQPL